MSLKRNILDFEISFYENLLKEKPDYVDALIPLAEAYTRKGFFEKGLEIDKRLARLCKEDPFIHYNLGCSYALLGKKEAALEALRRAIELGYSNWGQMTRDPDLKALYGNPEFQKLLSGKP